MFCRISSFTYCQHLEILLFLFHSNLIHCRMSLLPSVDFRSKWSDRQTMCCAFFFDQIQLNEWTMRIARIHRRWTLFTFSRFCSISVRAVSKSYCNDRVFSFVVLKKRETFEEEKIFDSHLYRVNSSFSWVNWAFFFVNWSIFSCNRWIWSRRFSNWCGSIADGTLLEV